VITEVASRLKIPLGQAQIALLDEYAERLLAANLRAGLTSGRTSREQLYGRHMAESLTLLVLLRKAGIELSPAIDIGSGGGLPGIPMAIAEPGLRITLLEATRKKADFLQELTGSLGLDSVEVVNERAETAAHYPERREKYALAVARAVAPFPVVLEYALPFLRSGGILAAPKGSGVHREVADSLRALQLLGGTVDSLRSLVVAGWEGPLQTAVLVRKTGETPAEYPRRTGVPARRPL
jgi:16S rRNA (guanine527-N7)-methyltransferase